MRGECVAELSRDLKEWRRVASRGEVSSLEGKVPAGLLPASELYLRFRAEGAGASLQVNRVEFEAQLDPLAPADTYTAYGRIFGYLGPDVKDRKVAQHG